MEESLIGWDLSGPRTSSDPLKLWGGRALSATAGTLVSLATPHTVEVPGLLSGRKALLVDSSEVVCWYSAPYIWSSKSKLPCPHCLNSLVFARYNSDPYRWPQVLCLSTGFAVMTISDRRTKIRGW